MTPKIITCFILTLILFIYNFYFFKKRNESFTNNTKRVAIISSLNYHFECLGFLCELFKNYEIDIYHVPEINNENYIGYFKKNYFNLTNFELNKFTPQKEHLYYKIIKLTSYDNTKIKNIEKILSILHYHNKNEKLLNKKYITLSPLVKSNASLINILPIYKVNNNNNNFNKKTIVFIGRAFKNDVDMFNKFIEKLNYKIIFFSRTKTNPSSNTFNNLNNKNKIEYNYGKDVEFMINKIKASTFLYIDKKDDRFSGAITLALSNNIPMIIDEFQKNIYGFPAITYDKNITEITNKLNNLSKDEYTKIVNNQINFSKEILSAYPSKLKEILN